MYINIRVQWTTHNIYYILSVYSPFSDRVGLPLHYIHIPSPFPSILSFLVFQPVFCLVVVVDLPLLRVAVEGSDNPISLEKSCQASLPPDQQRHHSRETSRGPVCCLRYIGVCS